MSRKVFAPLILFFLPLFVLAQKTEAVNGVLDLRNHDFSLSAKVKLNGEWKFVESHFLYSEPNEGKPPRFISAQVPKSWDGIKDVKSLKYGKGYGSYQLQILRNPGAHQTLILKDIGSCYKVWINGKEAIEIGKIGKNESSAIPSFKTHDLPLPDTSFVELTIEVANFHQDKGGLKSHLIVIENRQISLFHERESLMRYFCLGIIFIIGLYHLGLFVMNRKDKASMNFGLFCLDIFVFLVFRSRIVYYFYPEFDWNIGNRIEYIAIFYSLPLFYIFFFRSFPEHFRRFFNVLAMVLSGSLIVVTLFTDAALFTHSLNYFHLILLLYIFIVLAGLVRSLISKKTGARVILLGFLIFMIALVNDILHVQNIIDTGNFIIVGILGFIICQAYFLAYRSGMDQKRIQLLSVNLNHLNRSLERFVPADFMQLLKRKDITEVNLGNFVEKEMTIMFSDIRSFTSISERLSSEESFGFINDYLQTMGPIIRKHHGFIDKYIGDGIMALFPSKPDDAILCSQEMMQVLKKFNLQNEKLGKPVIEIGIGLHTGLCILGTVGEPRRMDTTVISDAVNLAARIESLTKHYKTPVIISADTYKKIDPKHQIQVRYIGTAVVKGKTIQTDLYKVFFEEEITLQLLDQFDQAIGYYYQQEFGKAKTLLLQLSQSVLYDGVLHLYLQRATQYEKAGPPLDWKTFEVFEY